MIKSEFFTISFTKDKLQIVYLNDTSLKKTRTIANVNLPENTIVDYKVVDKQKLSDLIKKSIKEVGIEESQVSLVIPEFSTYTKLIDLPRLKDEEVTEALKWQVKDFLPSATNEMIVDWKIAGEVGTSIQYLVVAIDKELLYGYIDAVIFADLTPVAVETQALSLVRIAGKEDLSRLIIYKNFEEVILVLSKGWRIAGSSVVAVDEEDVVLNTIRRMLQHYNKFKPEKIVVAGKGFNASFYQKIEQLTGLAPEGIPPSVDGLSSEEFNEYLVPISSQMATPEAPADSKSVNLLPAVFYESRQEKDFGLKMTFLFGFSAFVLLVCLLSAISFYIFMQSRFSNGNSIQENLPAQSQEVLDRVNKINSLTKKILAISEARTMPQEIINPINEAKPEGVVIDSYQLDLDKGGVSVAGTAPSRSDLLSFKTSLESSGDFGNVVIPVNALEQEADISFDMTFEYLPLKPVTKPKLKLQ